MCYYVKMVRLSDPGASSQRVSRRRRRPGAGERHYLFDAAFGPRSTQREVYAATTAPLVRAVLRGYNACVFAYGATGGGKTHTMVGRRGDDGRDLGCMVLAMDELFEAMDRNEESHFKVTLALLAGCKLRTAQ